MLRHIPSSKSWTSFFDPGKSAIRKLTFLEYHQVDVQNSNYTKSSFFPTWNYQRLYHGLATERHGFFYPFLLKKSTQSFKIFHFKVQLPGVFPNSESKFWDALTCVPRSFTEISSPWAGFHNQQAVVPGFHETLNLIAWKMSCWLLEHMYDILENHQVTMFTAVDI